MTGPGRRRAIGTARPTIGITGPDQGGFGGWLFAALGVVMAGGRPVRIMPRWPRRIDELDGLIIGGGADVDPALYGEVRQSTPLPPAPRKGRQTWTEFGLGLLLYPIIWLLRALSGLFFRPGVGDAARDRLELNLIAAAVERRLPLLGICRGEQLLNVYFDGTLHQDLGQLYIETPAVRTLLPRKMILVERGTCLASIVGEFPRKVNALHRQGVSRLGNGIVVAARDLNGIVQAIEHRGLPFAIGVQWHPEYLPQLPEQRRLFETLVQEAERRMPRAGRATLPTIL